MKQTQKSTTEKESEIQDSEKKEFCVLRLTKKTTINHVFDDSWFFLRDFSDSLRDFSDLNPKNGEIGRSCVELHLKIVCMKIFVIISTIFVKNCSNRFTDARSRLASLFNYFIINFLGIICYFQSMNWISSSKVNFLEVFYLITKNSEYLDFQWVPILTLNIFYDYPTLFLFCVFLFLFYSCQFSYLKTFIVLSFLFLLKFAVIYNCITKSFLYYFAFVIIIPK